MEARGEYTAEPVPDFRLAGLAIVEHRSGNHGAARAAMDRMLAELGDSVLYQQAQVLAQWGEAGYGHGAPAQGARSRRLRPDLCAQRPVPGPLRGDKRMVALLAGLGFDP